VATIDILLAGMSVNTDQSNLGLATIALIRGRNNILVDVAHCGRRRHLINALASRGLTPDDIQIVVLTHAHWDHSQNVDMFPHARFMIHPAELEYAKSPRKDDWATPRYFPATLQGLNVQPVVEGTEIEPGVRIIETPGHTRGHISVAVDTPDGVAVIAGDSFPDAGAVHRGQPYLVFWSQRDARASVQKIMKLGNIIYPGHDRPFRIASDGSTTYVGGVATIKVIAGFEPNDVGVGVTVSLESIKEAWVHPEAQG